MAKHGTIMVSTIDGSSRVVGSSHSLTEGGDAMEVKDALSLMFMFGMFIIALLSYLRKK